MKVQNEMSTRISVDTVSAIGSMSAFRNAIRGASDAWRAQETALRNSGNFTEAAKQRLSGLNQVIDLQKAKIQELRERQDGLDTSNEKQANQFLKLERQIQSANRQLASYEGQATRAKNAAQYQVSGLAQLQHQMHLTDDVNRSYVASLRAQGKAVEANKAEMSGLRTSLSSLEKQQTKQQFLLKQVEHQSGKTSDAYKQQQIQLNKTGEAIGKTQSRMKELDKSLNPPHTTAWTFFRNNILQVDSAEKKARDSALNFGSVLKANVFGGWIQQGFSTVTTGLKSMITNGMQVAKVGAAMEARWKNIGVSASGIKQLSNQVTQLKTNTNLSAQAVNALQSRFYGITHSVSQTRTLTKGVASLADQLKLSGKQADAFAGGLSRIESSGKVTSSSLGRLEKQAPGLTAAMSKASGMSQKAFQQLVSSGKMTSDQFNQILAKASRDYDKNSKAFGQSSGGALHRLQQEWATTQAKLAKPLLKVSATGLNELSKALNNKDTQRGLQVLAKGLADAAVQAAKFIGYIAKHQNTVKGFAVAILGLAAAFKGMQTAVVAADTIKKFGELMTGAKAVRAYSIATRGLGLAFRFMTGPIGIAITAIGAVGIALTALYKHNKKFRNFVNGLASDAKKDMSKVGHWFSSTFNNIIKSHRKMVRQQQTVHKQSERDWNKHHQAVSKSQSNFWKNYSKTQSRSQTASEKSWQKFSRNIAKFNNSLWKGITRGTNNGFRTIQRTTANGSKSVLSAYQRMHRGTSRELQAMSREHPRTFGAMYKVIQDRTRTWRDVVTGHWTRLGSDVARLAKDQSATARSIIGDMHNKLESINANGLGQMLNGWRKHFSNVIATITNNQGPVHNAFLNVLHGLSAPFTTVIRGLAKGINWIADKIGGSKISEDFAFAAFAKGTPRGGILHDQIALLNDGEGPHYQEMVHKASTGKTFMLPAKRNMLMPLEKGDEVLDGENSYRLAKAMGMAIPHASGAVGNFFSSVFDKVGDAIDEATDWVEKALKNVVEFGTEMFTHFVERMGGPKDNGRFLGKDLHLNLPSYMARIGQAWLKKQLESMEDDNGSAVTPDMIRKAAARMKISNLPDSFVNNLMTVIKNESGNRSIMQQIHDPNSGGNEARGVLQYTPGTFRAYAMPGHTNIWKPFDQLLAFFNNSDWRNSIGWTTIWGVRKMEWLHSGPQGHRRFANGGYVGQHGIYEMAEGNNPEMVIPLDQSKRGRAYDLLTQVLARFKGEDGASPIADSGDHQQLMMMNRKFDAVLAQNQRLIVLLDKLIGVTDSANNPTARYKRTQRDINLAHAQSLT